MPLSNKAIGIIDTGQKFAPFKNRLLVVNHTPAADRISLFIDYEASNGDVLRPSSIPGLAVFLSLARSYPELSSIFIQIGSLLYTINPKKTTWIKMRNGKELWHHAKSTGKRFDEIKHLIGV